MKFSFEWGIQLIFQGINLLLVSGYTKSSFGPPKPNRKLKVLTFTVSLKNMGTVSFNLKAKVLGYHGYRSIMTHRIHGTGIFTYTLPVKNQLKAGRYTSPVDPLGKSLQVALPFSPTVLNQVHLHRLWQSYDNRVSRQKGAFWYQVIG